MTVKITAKFPPCATPANVHHTGHQPGASSRPRDGSTAQPDRDRCGHGGDRRAPAQGDRHRDAADHAEQLEQRRGPADAAAFEPEVVVQDRRQPGADRVVPEGLPGERDGEEPR
jgi:hypothetical protein